MPDTEQVLIEFVVDDANLKSATDRLLEMGKIDQQSSIIFKATNDQLRSRADITGKISLAVTKEQAVVNKLVESLKSLSGESKKSVENLLKLSTDEISSGFDQAGISVDDYIKKLNKAQGSPGAFKATTDQLKAQDAQFGKTAATISKEQAVIDKLGRAFLSLTGESQKAVGALLKLPTEDIIKGFEQSGLSVDEYIASLTKVSGATDGAGVSNVKLTTRLREMRDELIRMELAGQRDTEAFQKLSAEAGHLSDAISDVSVQTKVLGSDTAVFDGLISGVQGLAGGFAVAQGAAALFGDSSEEVQEVLLRVNAAMAILQGLQQIQNVLQRESALSLLVLNVQRKVQNAQLVVETGLQSKSVIVRGLATAAQWALNAAMAANPIGIVVVALATMITLFALYARGAKEAAVQQAALNGALKEAGEGLDAEISGIKQANALIVSEMEANGAKRSDILRQNAKTEVQIEQARQRQLADLRKTIEQNKNADKPDAIKALQDARAKEFEIEQQSADALINLQIKNREGQKVILEEKLQDAISIQQAILDKVLASGGKNTAKDFQAQRDRLKAQSAFEIQQAGEDAAKILSIRANLAKDLHTIDVEQRDQRNKETLAKLNTELLAAQEKSRAINERETQEEIDIKKKRIIETARQESEQEGVLANKRIEIRKTALIEISNLQKEFNKQSVVETLQDFISTNNVQLQNLNLVEEEKLNLKIDNIIAAASIEEEQNKGLSAKIKEINAKRDADIKAARLQSIQETLNFELKSFEINFAGQNREIDRQLNGQDALRGVQNKRQQDLLAKQLGVKKLSLEEETDLIDKQTRHSLDGIQKERDALQKSFKERLISAKQYEQDSADLTDKAVQVVENAEEKKRHAIKATADFNKAKNIEMLSALVEITGQVGNVLLDVFQANLDRQQQKIDNQKQRINDLKEAGAISEKEAIDRLRQVDREERKLKREQAVKDKEAAIFNATINTFQAVIKAYATVGPIAGPILAAIAGAIGFAQVALIASKPIPQFSKGKKNQYEGLGEIGEKGAELFETHGQMYVAKKPAIVWIGKKDIVYNPKETKEIINRIMPTVNHKVVVNGKEYKSAPAIDYEKLGEAVGKHTSMSLNIDGYKEFIKEQQSFQTYLNSRRGF